MAKRFTDSEKWKKVWYRKLLPLHKNFWEYIRDNCNHAGVWEVDFDLASYQIGAQLDENEVKKAFADHITVLNSGSKWVLNDWVKFQYKGELNPKNRTHKSVLDIYKTLNYKPLTSPSLGCKDKDKDKDKDKEEDIMLSWLDKDTWDNWVAYRKDIKKKLTPRSIALQLKILEENKEHHKEIINQSIQNGWTGLFPLREKATKKSPFGRLHDGTKVEHKFGRWVDAQNPNANFDLSYYKELANDTVISEEDWQKGKRYTK